HVVDRLAMIETGLRSNHHGQRPAPGVPVESPASAPQTIPASAATTNAAPTPPSAPLGNPAPATDRRPIDPDLPPDYPIEPGPRRGPPQGGRARGAAGEFGGGPASLHRGRRWAQPGRGPPTLRAASRTSSPPRAALLRLKGAAGGESRTSRAVPASTPSQRA